MKIKRRPFRGCRRKQGMCVPVLAYNVTRKRALSRGSSLDNIVQFLSHVPSFSHPCARVQALSLSTLSFSHARNKTVHIHDSITASDFDLLFMADTWLYDQSG